ncbi:alpha/beta hydrolase [Paenibacillus sp. sgz500958]|uniref:alpha/beta hydrolase n=1 Tax=Paenibacillus sp. sgz500958 TaxID=3242475 RepID=UPI0036D388DE
MGVSNILMSSYWGHEVRHKHITQGSKVLAVLFPGKNYSAERSLLDYATKAAREYKCDILILEYGYQSARAELKREEIGIVVEECKSAVGQLTSYEQFLFISKSMGTTIAGRVAEELGIQERTSHMYLTPLADTIPYIQRSRGSVIYGSNDPLFGESHSQEIGGLPGLRVYRIDDANHALEVDSVSESVAILIVIINIYHEFLLSALQA